MMNKKILFTVLAICWVSICIAGPGGPPDGGGGGSEPACWPPSTCLPIDGGLSYLVLAGLAFGGKKLLDSRKNS